MSRRLLARVHPTFASGACGAAGCPGWRGRQASHDCMTGGAPNTRRLPVADGVLYTGSYQDTLYEFDVK